MLPICRDLECSCSIYTVLECCITIHAVPERCINIHTVLERSPLFTLFQDAAQSFTMVSFLAGLFLNWCWCLLLFVEFLLSGFRKTEDEYSIKYYQNPLVRKIPFQLWTILRGWFFNGQWLGGTWKTTGKDGDVVEAQKRHLWKTNKNAGISRINGRIGFRMQLLEWAILQWQCCGVQGN